MTAFIVYGWLLCVDIHIGVGFSVARSDEKGQCKSLEEWDEWTGGSHALFVFAPQKLNLLSICFDGN